MKPLKKFGKRAIWSRLILLLYFTILAVAPLIIALSSILSLINPGLQLKINGLLEGAVGNGGARILLPFLNGIGSGTEISVMAAWSSGVLLAISFLVIVLLGSEFLGVLSVGNIKRRIRS